MNCKVKLVKILLAVFSICLCACPVFATREPSCIGYKMVKESRKEINLYALNDDQSQKLLAVRRIKSWFTQENQVGEWAIKSREEILDDVIDYVSEHYSLIEDMKKQVELGDPYAIKDFSREYEIYNINMDQLLKIFGFSCPV